MLCFITDAVSKESNWKEKFISCSVYAYWGLARQENETSSEKEKNSQDAWYDYEKTDGILNVKLKCPNYLYGLYLNFVSKVMSLCPCFQFHILSQPFQDQIIST